MSQEYTVQNHTISSIASKFGTPFYLYDANILEEVYLELRQAIHDSVEIFYSLKANPNISIYNYLRNLGACAEVCSHSELLTSIKAGTSPENIIFLGPGKSEKEIRACLQHNIYAIVCESFQELEIVNDLAQKYNLKPNVALRINPAFSVKGSRLTMGGKPRQFGIDEAAILDNPELLSKYTHIRIMGIHVYMGTRMLEIEPIVENTSQILNLAERIEEALGINLEMVDFGGGLGIPYFEGEESLNIIELAKCLNPIISSFKNSHPKTRLIMELGRYLVGKSGLLVSKVLYLKESYGETFAVTDGGTNCHMAAVGIGSYVKRNFPIAVLNRYGEQVTDVYNITGPLCTPNDVVAKKISLPKLFPGDLIGVFHSGAYGPTASPTHFLSHGYPAEVLVMSEKAHLIRDRDTPSDLLGKQHLVEVQQEFPVV
ncbi:diaminopimelate decarboxylase [Paenibacillus sp. An7]|uniref:diaminopimelate decarboxylase n=1 Tax=Paenibacillus sp. An7 TaxID=2689577 RepID=UPI00135A1E46|nr:diaminopimelate decarboxylase [Paenibacillus sp. An7]